jgi:hypothetical protein
MNVGMDEVERVLKRAVSTGAAVVVVILGPGQGAAPPSDRPATSGQVTTATVTPVPSTTPDRASAPGLTPAPDPTAPDPTAYDPTTYATGAPDPAASPRTGRATAEPRRTVTTTPLPTTDVSPTTETRRATTATRTDSTGTGEGDRARTGSSAVAGNTRVTRTPPTSRPRATGTASPTDPPTTGPGTTDTTDTTGTPGAATAGTTAAATQGWGTPTRVEDFDAGTHQWQLYDGPGNDHKGRRSPSAVVIQDGVATLNGDATGTTGGMCWGTGRRYGRWEGRVRAPAADPSYHATLLLWPTADPWPAGGEIDFMELVEPDRRLAEGFVHHGADNRTERGTVEADATQWHNWAVEWTPSSITMYLDGRPWYRTTDSAVQPPGPMHLCLQLDWFPTGATVAASTMQVDWVREYGSSGTAATRGKPGGATETGASRTGTAG